MRLTAYSPDGIGEVTEGTDLAALVLEHLEPADGDIVVVTSKVVSKAEGRIVVGDREDAITAETVRIVARQGPTRIVRTRHGLTMAAAGVDASNVEPGSVVLLPEDPDASARDLRTALHDRTGLNVAVIVTDTAGRAWREGQTDIAIGAAGLQVLEQYAGRHDAYGNELAVTAPAVADELAGLAELASGKLGGRPLTLVSGRADLVLPAGDHGVGAQALIRAESDDLFGLGAREAVLAAMVGDPATRTAYGTPAGRDEAIEAIARVAGAPPSIEGEALVVPLPPEVAAPLAHALGWTCESAEAADHRVGVRFHPSTT
jgi:coenzyme F420-0:L-glutamate ligase/coenzyme F420-1:gamma-L-glutamate ligase